MNCLDKCSGVDLPQTNQNLFHLRYSVFYSPLKSKVIETLITEDLDEPRIQRTEPLKWPKQVERRNRNWSDSSVLEFCGQLTLTSRWSYKTNKHTVIFCFLLLNDPLVPTLNFKNFRGVYSGGHEDNWIWTIIVQSPIIQDLGPVRVFYKHHQGEEHRRMNVCGWDLE
jgi:hypothetical protein